MQQATSKQTDIKMPARKIRRVIDLVRGKSAVEAGRMLKYMPYFAARVVEKNLKEATELLGKPFFADGKVLHGLGLGKKLGFPTVNLEFTSEKFTLPAGVYFTAVKIERVGKIGNVYTATITYSVIDYYNWDSNDTEEVPLVGVSPAELHQLHVSGRAKEFLTYGEKTYVISWVIGASAESAMND
jgi:hypothetical protein